MDCIRLRRSFCLWTALAVCGTLAGAAPGKTGAASGKHAADAAMSEMPLIAPLFIENGQLSTTVTIVSAMARATTVDVILLDQKGAEIIQQNYALDGHDQLVVKVSDLLQAANSGVFLGSVKIETDSEAQMNMAVLGQVSIAGTTQGVPVYLEEEFPMTGPGDTGVLRAVAPAVLGFPVLALRSTSTSWQTVTENCFYEHAAAAQSTVQLAPGAVVLSGACTAGGGQLSSFNAGWNQQTLDNKGAAGISLTSTGGVGALCAYGFALSGKAASPIYTALNFTDAGSVGSGNTVFAGVPVGQAAPLGSDVFAPTLALTNFGTTPVNATVTLAVTGGNGPNGQTVATVTVAGQSSVTVPLESLKGDSQMRNSFTVQSDAARGALYASMTIFGGATVGAVQLLGRDWGQPYNAGAHPWTTAAGVTSTLLLFNYSTVPRTFFVVITSGGVLWQQRYQLAALETKALDIGSLIATGAKDENGLVLPPAATAGVAQWFTPNYGTGTGRLLVSQPNAGLARSFGCYTAVTLCGSSSLSNSSVTIPAGGSGQMGPFNADMCLGTVGVCGGTYDFTTSWEANWTSSNASVASIPSPSDTAAVTINGNSAGTAAIGATPVSMTDFFQPEDITWTCYAAQQSGTATVYDPTPVITGLTQNSFVVGQTTTGVTISGQNFGTNQPQVTLSLGGTVTVTSYSDTQIVVSVTPSNAGTGYFTVASEGFNGQGFIPSGGQSQNSGPSPQVTVSAPTVSVTAGPTYILAAQTLAPGLTSPSTSTCVTITAASDPASGGTFSWTTSSSVVTLSNTSSATVTVCSATGQSSSASSKSGEAIKVTYTVSNTPSSPATTLVVVLLPSALVLQTSNFNPTGFTCVAATSAPTPACVNCCSSMTYADNGVPPGSQYTSYLLTRQYYINDQYGNKITLNMGLNESYSIGVNTGSGTGATVSDCFSHCSQACRQGGTDTPSATQTIYANGFAIATESVSWSCTGATVTP